MGALLEEVVLDAPNRMETRLVGPHWLLEHLVERTRPTTRPPVVGHRYLVVDREPHPLRSPLVAPPP
jgi:hypothetical protein